ncbi:hypothetical protein SteCoe_12656 [Stentor coeruleus]|uniref:Uncharacterized protein n=1 Tax=Stentor coeruleus TaxID=5963 RepID=A0A1R2CAD5_9CILI|nr:hypothetical protein SteCoe_12656 [Stentor coeruleus]
MKTRSKSLAKIPSFDIAPRSMYSIKSIHEKESNRVYGDKGIWMMMMRKPSYICVVPNDYDKLPDMYKRNDKSFDKISQSSPAKRIQKLKEARLFRYRRTYLKGNSKLSIGSNCQDVDVTENEVSSLRRQKSIEIVRQVSEAVIKEKENEINLKKLSQDFSDIIQLKTKAIRRHTEKSAERRDKKFNSLLISQRRVTSKKRILTNIN